MKNHERPGRSPLPFQILLQPAVLRVPLSRVCLKTAVFPVDTVFVSGSRSPSARRQQVIQVLRRRIVSVSLAGLLVLLSFWAVTYELSCTVLPALLQAPLWRGIAPDIAFAVAGFLVIARGMSAWPAENGQPSGYSRSATKPSAKSKSGS